MLHGIDARPEDHERMHRHLQKAANERGRRSANCLGCGQRFEPERPSASIIDGDALADDEAGLSDFRLYGEGPMTTVFRLVPVTDEAKAWIADNVSREGFQPDWPTLFIEHRFMDALLGGIGGSGLTVDVIERALAH